MLLLYAQTYKRIKSFSKMEGSTRARARTHTHTIYIYIYIVTWIAIDRQRLGKLVPALTSLNSRGAVFYVIRPATVAMHWSGNHA
jgi:hypothetical protein